MKKLLLVLVFLSMCNLFAQDLETEITSDNSWLKLGVIAGVPVGDASDFANFNIGLDFRAQHLLTPSWGIGGASGYNHYFGKDGVDDYEVIPLAGFIRYYFTPSGLFFGTDIGYGFLTNIDNNDGGLYINPQIGYHNRDWNIYGFYQNAFTENDVNLQSVGFGVTYNIRFK